MRQNPRTLIFAREYHLQEYIAANLLPHLEGANVTMYERPNDAHYGDNGELHEKKFDDAMRAASHLIVAVAAATRTDVAAVRKMFGWAKPLCLMVKSADPSVYEKLGLLHKKRPRFKVVVAVGGPNGVQQFFSRDGGVSTTVFTPFDLEHKPWLLMTDVLHKLWN